MLAQFGAADQQWRAMLVELHLDVSLLHYMFNASSVGGCLQALLLCARLATLAHASRQLVKAAALLMRACTLRHCRRQC